MKNYYRGSYTEKSLSNNGLRYVGKILEFVMLNQGVVLKIETTVLLTVKWWVLQVSWLFY
jgi:hypothetical protein